MEDIILFNIMWMNVMGTTIDESKFTYNEEQNCIVIYNDDNAYVIAPEALLIVFFIDEFNDEYINIKYIYEDNTYKFDSIIISFRYNIEFDEYIDMATECIIKDSYKIWICQQYTLSMMNKVTS